jgi:hypothetical protein
MKCKKIILLAVATILAFTITSCAALLSSLFGVSIEDQIVAFEDTLNTPDRTDILDHIHPEMLNRDQLNDPAVIDVSPLGYANQPFTFGTPNVGDNDVAVCSYLDGNGATGTIEFAMALDGYDYKILKLTLTVNADVFELKRLR